MIRPILVAAIALFMFGKTPDVWAQANPQQPLQPCLNYWQVGDATKCAQPAKPVSKTTPSPTAVVAPPPAAVTPTAAASPTQPESLDAKIDKFLENYGKPPREFVAFYLDPSQENAVKWVHAYQQILDRPQQLAYVWTQAEQLYKQALDSGQISPATFNNDALAPVKDFGIQVPGYTSPIPTSSTMPTWEKMMEGSPIIGPVVNQSALKGAGVSPLAVPAAAGTLQPQQTGGLTRAAPVVTTKPPEGQTIFTYYFSAVCPYCHRFNPVLNQVASALPNKPKIICVDLTPYTGPDRPQANPNNMEGVIDCNWRMPSENETTTFGIKQTPTLLIQRYPDGPYERINGYVEADKLINYLVQGK